MAHRSSQLLSMNKFFYKGESKKGGSVDLKKPRSREKPEPREINLHSLEGVSGLADQIIIIDNNSRVIITLAFTTADAFTGSYIIDTVLFF